MGVVDAAMLTPDGTGLDLYLQDPDAPGVLLPRRTLSLDDIGAVQVVAEDGAAPPASLLAGLWGEWILSSARSAASTVLASAPLKPFPHQMVAVYERMLTQPQLRFLLADEPGTGKTIMSGLWLREAQRLGMVRRALVVCPAHLVHKWIADFDRYFGGGLREITAETHRQDALAVPGQDLWVVSMNLAAQNRGLLDALHPDKAGWDAVIFDEAHRMTPTAETFHRVGLELSATVPHALLLTATPHRGDEWYFRELMHLVDPDVFPTSPRADARRRGSAVGVALQPGPLHFLRRMKEELVHYDTQTRLFKEREARNIKVDLSSVEQRLYDHAQELVRRFFPSRGRQLAAMVYGKRTASSLHALAETLRRRSDNMGTDDRLSASSGFDGDVEDTDDNEQRVVSAASLDARAEKKEIKALLTEIDDLLAPAHPAATGAFEASKWPEMVACLQGHGIVSESDEQAVVFTEYADTAHWLVAALKRAGFSVESYSGANTHDERAEIQGRFMEREFQVIVSTDAGNEGIDLQAAHVLVNWDVPWSLVRLEQRMGRIHRIGQDHKVWLYNLVARGTREGDAHERLLDRLVDAANELGGQMFDSLNAILERARSAQSPAEPQRLMRLFYDTGDGFGADWPTLAEIRAARDQHYAEMRELATAVDADTADTARHDDRLSRVNPVIVERFLKRADKAGLLRREKAATGDEGFFYLSANPAEHGWTLPAPFHTENGPTLVATQAEERQKAITAGRASAESVVMLGPSDPPLTALAHGLRQRLAAELYQGAVLTDPTAGSDYTLFVYECDITEGSHGPGPRQRPRTSVCSRLIRVNPDGTAAVVAWDTLANLTTTQHPTARPLDAETAVRGDACAAAAAEAEREGRSVRLSRWARQLAAQLRCLPDDLTRAITDRKVRQQRRTEITEATDKRIAAARAAAKVTCSTPRRIAWAHVAGTAAPDDDGDDPDSETVSMRHVTGLLEGAGWKVADVSRDGRGYDLHAKRASEQRCVEVKGRKGPASTAGITLTGGELAEAAQLRSDYWLYVVENCADGTGSLYGAWPDPAETFRDRFADVALVRLAGSELKAALHRQGDPR